MTKVKMNQPEKTLSACLGLDSEKFESKFEEIVDKLNDGPPKKYSEIIAAVLEECNLCSPEETCEEDIVTAALTIWNLAIQTNLD